MRSRSFSSSRFVRPICTTPGSNRAPSSGSRLAPGDLVEVSPGPAAAAFAVCVLLSLMASATFDPHVLWRVESEKETRS